MLNIIRKVKALLFGETHEARYEIRRAENKDFYFVLKAENHKTILVSEMYTTKAAAENGINAVRRCAVTTRVKDISCLQ